MAVSGVSAGYPDPVGTLHKRGKNKFWRHPAGAGNSNDPDIGGILHPAYPSQVSGPVTAPVAEKRYDFWFPI
jgi:hypothetical protein